MGKRIAVCAIALALCPALLGQQGPPSFLNIVALGDSLTLGVKSGGVNSQDQIEAYPALVARQAGTFFFLPLVFGPEIQLVQPTIPPVTETIPPSSAGRVFPLIVPQNLAIGGHDVADGLMTRPDFTSQAEIDSLEDLILGLPLGLLPPEAGGPLRLSQIELAVAHEPSFIFYWLGSNDVLGAVSRADASLITPLTAFRELYTQSLGALRTLTNADIVVGNIPDVTVIAFLFSAQEVADLAGAPLAAIAPALGITENDFVTLVGLGDVQAILTGQQQGPLSPGAVFTAEELATTRAAVIQMNAVIAAVASGFGVPVADINGFLNEAHANGIQAGEFMLTTDYLGGIFSLDGIHPTATAQALTANRFISTINEFWGLSIPEVDVAAVARNDDLVLSGGAQSAIRLHMGDPRLRKASFGAARKAVEMIAPSLETPKESKDRRSGFRR